MANTAQHTPPSPSNPTGGQGVPPPPRGATSAASPPPSGGGATVDAIQISSRADQPHSRRWMPLVVATGLVVALGFLFYKRDKENSQEGQASASPPPSPAENNTNNPPKNTNVAQPAPLTPAQYEEISRWKKNPPTVPAPDDLYGRVSNSDRWLETGSRFNMFLVHTIRAQIEALSDPSLNKNSRGLNRTDAVLQQHPLAARIAKESKLPEASWLAPAYLSKEITQELSLKGNEEYRFPEISGIRYAKSASNPSWPRRWPEYIITRVDSLVKLHEALLKEQASK